MKSFNFSKLTFCLSLRQRFSQQVSVFCCAHIVIVALGLLSNESLAQPGGHQHGAASLQVVQEGNQLSMDLHTPLENVLGFEHAPKTAADTQAVQNMMTKLRQMATMVILSPTAQCQPQPIQLHALMLNLREIADQNTHVHLDEHADLNVNIKWHCSNPSALRAIEVKLFQSFPGLQHINVQMVGPNGQSASKLTPQQMKLAW